MRMKRWPVLMILLFLAAQAGSLSPTRADPLEDLQKFRELQNLAVKAVPYSTELGEQVTELVWELAPKTRFRHQVATLLSVNGAFLDSVLNRHYLDSLPAEERDLPNFARVDRKLYRGGSPTEAGFRRLKELGIRTVVNLRLEDPSEEALVKSLGMDYVYLPVRDTNRPSDEQIEAFLALLHRRDTGRVYVHCAAGVNRTGTMVALWRIETGMSPDAALAEAVQFGFDEKNLACDRPAALIRNFRPGAGIPAKVSVP